MLFLMTFGALVLGALLNPAQPAGPRVSGTDWVYVTDGSGALTVWSPAGKLVQTIPKISARAVAVGENHWIYVLEYGQVAIYKEGATAPFKTFSLQNYYQNLEDISVGYNGTVYITDEFGTSSRFGGVLVYPPGKTQPSKILMTQGFNYFFGVASDYDGDVFTTVQGYSSSGAGVYDFPKAGGAEELPAAVDAPDGIDVAPNGELVICTSSGAQTFAIDASQPSSTINVPCRDISLANNGHSIWIVSTSGAVQRYSYPGGKLEVTLRGMTDSLAVAVQGSISD